MWKRVFLHIKISLCIWAVWSESYTVYWHKPILLQKSWPCISQIRLCGCASWSGFTLSPICLKICFRMMRHSLWLYLFKFNAHRIVMVTVSNVDSWSIRAFTVWWLIGGLHGHFRWQSHPIFQVEPMFWNFFPWDTSLTTLTLLDFGALLVFELCVERFANGEMPIRGSRPIWVVTCRVVTTTRFNGVENIL